MAPDDQTKHDPGAELLRRRVKAEIRKRMRGVRASAPASACAARSARIVEALRAHEALGAGAVALFWPMEDRHEVDLRPLDEAVRARGARVAYPSIDGETGAMTFRFVDDPKSMEERGRGFLDPGDGAPEALPGDLAAIVVPALALDAAGHRLGYGAGYYDRALARHAPHAATLGVAYDYQLVVELPVDEWDVPLDWIVTDARVLRAAR